jgi:hypothetical protein
MIVAEYAKAGPLTKTAAIPKPSQHLPSHMHTRTPRRLVTIALAATSLAALSGCYEETVSAKGVGASGIAVQDSRRSNTALDRWFDDVTGNTPPKPDRTGVFSGSPSTRELPDRFKSN